MKVIIAIFLSSILLVSTLPQTNANLVVSRDKAEEGLKSLLNYELEYEFRESTGCTSLVPKNWDHKSYIRYIDVMTPTFDVGFRKDYPLIIGETVFKRTDFTTSSKTVKIEPENPVQVKLRIFENTGPHNINKIKLITNLQENNITKIESDTYITIQKEITRIPGPPIYQYIYGGIEEDPYRSYTYPNKLGNYFVTLNDPNNLFSDVSASVSKVNYKMEVVLDITFAKEMKKSNLVITASDVEKNQMICNVHDVWEVSSQIDNLE